MTEDIEFRMELIIGIGRGYVSADRQISEGHPTGFIPIDSVYSPILKVNFSVTHQRAKERMNFDKLILEIFQRRSGAKICPLLAAKIIRDMAGKISPLKGTRLYP